MIKLKISLESILTLIAFQWDYLVTIFKKSISWEWTIWKADKNWSILWKRANWLSLIKKKNDHFSRLWNNTIIKKSEGTVRSRSPLLFFCFLCFSASLFISYLFIYPRFKLALIITLMIVPTNLIIINFYHQNLMKHINWNFLILQNFPKNPNLTFKNFNRFQDLSLRSLHQLYPKSSKHFNQQNSWNLSEFLLKIWSSSDFFPVNRI